MLVYLEYPYSALVVLVVALLFWRPVWGIALLVAIFPMDTWSPRLPVPGMNTETIMLGVAFAMTVLRFGARIPPLQFSAPVFAFIAVIMMAFVVSTTWASGLVAVDGSPAIWFIFKTVKSSTFTALLFFIAYWWLARPEDRQLVLVALCFACFLASFVGIVDYFFHINPLVEDGRERANGLLADANALAESIGPIMFIPLYFLMRRREHGRALLVFAATTYALGVVALVLALSRGNWLAFIAAHVVFLLLVNRKLLLVAIATAAVLAPVGLGVMPAIVRDRIFATTDTGPTVYRLPMAVGLTNSAAARVVFAQIGLDMFRRSPIWGNGLRAFHFRTPEFGAKYGLLVHRDPHNLVTMLAAEAGVIGLAMLAWVVFGIFRCGRLLWRSNSSEYLLGAVLLAAATHDLVANVGSTALLHVSQISAQFWLLFGLVARACVERFAEAEAPAGVRTTVARWRRFAERPRIAVPQSQP